IRLWEFHEGHTESNDESYRVSPADLYELFTGHPPIGPVIGMAFMHEKSKGNTPESPTGGQAADAPKFMKDGKRIFDPDFIQEQRRHSALQPTVAFDLQQTLGYTDMKGAWHLRPGVEQLLSNLRNDGIRLVLWSADARESVGLFFEQHPRMAAYFDLIITRENFAVRMNKQGVLPEEKTQLESSYPGIDFRRVINFYHSEYYDDFGISTAKDLGLLGYTLLVDDKDLENSAKLAPIDPYQTYKIRMFVEEAEELIVEGRIPPDDMSAISNQILKIVRTPPADAPPAELTHPNTYVWGARFLRVARFLGWNLPDPKEEKWEESTYLGRKISVRIDPAAVWIRNTFAPRFEWRQFSKGVEHAV